MARGSGNGNVLMLAGLLLAAYAAYEAARRGQLGIDAQQIVSQIQGGTTYR